MDTPEHQHPDKLWQEARSAYGAGRTARQIACVTGLSPVQISARAQAEHWPAPPPPDWAAIRDCWQNGEDAGTIAGRFGISARALRQACKKGNWNRPQASGLAALRRAVTALEQALDDCGSTDPVSTARLAAALSMAAGRLSRIEKKTPDDADKAHDSDDPAAADARVRAQIECLLLRLAGAEDEP